MKEQAGNVLRANRDGHVVIPSEVVSQLGIGSGEGLHWVIDDGRLVLMPRIKLVRKLIGLFGHSKQPVAQSDEHASGTETTSSRQSARRSEFQSEAAEATGAS